MRESRARGVEALSGGSSSLSAWCVAVVAPLRSAALAAGSERAGGLVDGVGTEGVATSAKSVAERALVAST